MKRLAVVVALAVSLAGCGDVGDEQAFPVDVTGLAQSLAVPGQPILVLGTGFQDDGSISAYVDGHTVPVVRVDPAYLVLTAPDAVGSHEVTLEISTTPADGEGGSGEPAAPYELGAVEVVASLAPLVPAMDAGKGAVASWHSYTGRLSGELGAARGTALVAGLDFGPHVPPTVPFVDALSVPYAIVLRGYVDGNGGPLLASTDAVPVLIDGLPSGGNLEAGPHELEVRLSIESALEDLELHVNPPGTLQIPGAQ